MVDWNEVGEELAQSVQHIAAVFHDFQQKMVELMELSDEIEATSITNPPNEYARKTASLRNRNRQNLYSKTPKTKYKLPIRRIN